MMLFNFGIARVHRAARNSLWAVFFHCGCDTYVQRNGTSYRDTLKYHLAHNPREKGDPHGPECKPE